MSTYSEKLRDPRWQKRRCEIFEAKGHKCYECGETPPSLDIHHLCYLKGREPWEYADEYLMPICRPCHENRQSIEDEAKESLALLFGNMNIWRVYEMGKAARRMIGREDCTPVMIDLNLTKPTARRLPLHQIESVSMGDEQQ